jgi:hypothetical protein
MEVRFIFEPRDLWVGVFIGKLERQDGLRSRAVYILPFPCVGIVVTLRWRGAA